MSLRGALHVEKRPRGKIVAARNVVRTRKQSRLWLWAVRAFELNEHDAFIGYRGRVYVHRREGV